MANGYWKEIKDLFKSKQRLREEEAQAVGDAVKNEEEILKKLRQIEENYRSTITNDSPNFDELFPKVTLDRIDIDVLSDEEIIRNATDKTNSEYASKFSDINTKTFNKIAELNERSDKEEKVRNASLEEIEKLFKNLKEKNLYDSIKQGIQRSSIVDESNETLSNTRQSEREKVLKKYDDEIKLIDDKLHVLENERLDALNNLELAKAVDLTKNITSLQDQRKKTIDLATQKNNAIEKQEAELNAKMEKEKEKYIASYNKNQLDNAEAVENYEKKYGYSGEKLKSYADRYNIALDFYLSLDPDVAPKALEASANMKYYLGNFYNKLMDVLVSRINQKKEKYI